MHITDEQKKVTASLKTQGAYRAEMRAMREQSKQLKERMKAIKDKISHVLFGKIRVQLSDKGAISIYGLQKFPVTLYKNQFDELKQVLNDPRFKQWAEENKGELKTKEQVKAEELKEA